MRLSLAHPRLPKPCPARPSNSTLGARPRRPPRPSFRCVPAGGGGRWQGSQTSCPHPPRPLPCCHTRAIQPKARARAAAPPLMPGAGPGGPAAPPKSRASAGGGAPRPRLCMPHDSFPGARPRLRGAARRWTPTWHPYTLPPCHSPHSSPVWPRSPALACIDRYLATSVLAPRPNASRHQAPLPPRRRARRPRPRWPRRGARIAPNRERMQAIRRRLPTAAARPGRRRARVTRSPQARFTPARRPGPGRHAGAVPTNRATAARPRPLAAPACPGHRSPLGGGAPFRCGRRARTEAHGAPLAQDPKRKTL